MTMSYNFSFPLLVTFFFSLFVFIKIWKKKPINNTPPGPWKLPFLGNIHQLVTTQLHPRLTELAKTYGPIMQIEIGQISAVIISSAESAKQVLKTEEQHFLNRPLFLAIEVMLYNGCGVIFSQYGDYWKEMRKIVMLEVLNAKRIKSFRSIREKEVSNFMENLRSNSGSPVNLTRALLSLTYSIIAISTTGKKCEKEEEIIEIITEILAKGGGFSVGEAFPSLMGLMSGLRASLIKLHRKADRILEEILSEHRANRGAGDRKREAYDMVDVLLDIQDRENGFNLTTNDVKAFILETLTAATDTSSLATQWAMSELMKNPEVMKKAQEEVRKICRGKKTVDEEDIHEMKYLKSIIKETFRMHPPIPLVPRECVDKTQLNGYTIYRKTRVLINAGAIGRDPKIWEQPNKFYPERFLNSSIEFKGNDFELLPFGAGKRICPGITMASVNIGLTIAQMLLNFDWKMPDGARSESINMSESFGLAVKRKTDLILVPIPYNT